MHRLIDWLENYAIVLALIIGCLCLIVLGVALIVGIVNGVGVCP